MVKVIIDNKEVVVPEGTNIVDAAAKLDIHIPTLCYLNLPHLGVENCPAGCRICVVEIEGRRNLAPSCSTKCTEGMKITTSSIRVMNARKVVMQMILSDHPKDCLTCSKSGHCDLQTMAARLGIRHIPGEKYAKMSTYSPDTSPSIIRDMDKCILCRRCETMCNSIQSVGALHASYRGFDAIVTPAFEQNLVDSTCTFCGQCVAVCPTGALTEFDSTARVVRMLANPAKTVIVQTAPAVRAALGEEFGLPAGTLVTGKMVAALRRLGFDYVFDTDFAADLTIMEEGAELLDRITRHIGGDKDVRLPMLTSCCPAWVNFIETYFSDMLDVPSTARSPQQMFGSIAKSYFAEKIGVKREDMIVVSIMPCLAKKYECSRDEFKVDGIPDVDYSLSTREIAQLIKEANIDLSELPDEEFDSPMGSSTGAAVIFGTTGGVIEAAVRTAYELYTKKPLDKIEFTQLRGMDGIRSATVDFDGLELKIGIAHSLSNARTLLERVREGSETFHAIEIMACPGGCIGGGGQPLHHGDENILEKRAQALYEEDRGKPLRKSHENPDIIRLYQEFLGKPLSHTAHKLLHTTYHKKKC
ncbi:MAG: NADH-dependent [FeFe] hydrogenase, group A6 [Rikenellaceae bacterium]